MQIPNGMDLIVQASEEYGSIFNIENNGFTQI